MFHSLDASLKKSIGGEDETDSRSISSASSFLSNVKSETSSSASDSIISEEEADQERLA